MSVEKKTFEKLLGIMVLGLLWMNTSYALSFAKDVASGSKFEKSYEIIQNMNGSNK